MKVRALLFAVLLVATGLGAAVPATNHWAFQPLSRPAPPPVKNKAWPRTAVDAFLLARIEEQGMKPAPPAEKATLLRRVTFDLHGLPPTPAELDTFLADKSPDAFAKVVDRLLASPRYGERWARHWLDVARFSESDGFEYDKMREHAWQYRDYVIRALNEDKPYARFVTEQIAGDALEPVTRDGVTATGFLVAGSYDEAGNSSVSASLKARIREEEMEEIISAVGQTFLGVTVNCARCHDHKFDPIPQTDYYRLKAALDGVRRGNRPAFSAAELKEMDERLSALRRRVRELERESAAIDANARARAAAAAKPQGNETNHLPALAVPAPLARWTFEGDAKDAIGNLHGTLAGGAVISNGRLKLNGKDAFVHTGPLGRELREKTLEAWVSLGSLTQQGGGVLSVETVPGAGQFDAIVFGERVGRRWMAGSSSFQRTRDLDAPDEMAAPGELVHMAIVYHADNRIAVYRNGQPYGPAYTPAGENSTLRAYPATTSRVLFGLRHTGAGNGFLAGEIEEARLYDRALTPEEVAASARGSGIEFVTPEALARALTPEEQARGSALRDELAKLRAELNVPRASAYTVMPRQPEATFVLVRGDFEQRREQVTAGALSAVAGVGGEFGLPAEAPEAGRRLRLAGWITSETNPLAWRVVVNRVWHHHFGRGLVGTPNDFGVNGEGPTHPELLDWLAGEFRGQGGSLKKLHRLILLSAVYQQSSIAADVRRLTSKSKMDQSLLTSAATNGNDGDNRFLSRLPLRRLEAEAVRDAMLAVSGQLNPRMGGPGFRPFKITVSNSHFYDLIDGDGPEFNRRSIYRAAVQSAKDPLLESLDCPDPSTKTPTRGVTTTPLQALSLMNSAFVQRQAKFFGERVGREAGKETAAQVKLAYRLALGREPRRDELKDSSALARAHGLESVCWALLNASEFLYVR